MMKNLILGLALGSWMMLAGSAGAQDFSSPQAVFESYKKAAADGDVGTYTACTTSRSRQMLAGRNFSASQLKAEYRALSGKEYRIDMQGDTATLYFIPEEGSSSPYLFKKEDGKWKLDLAAMSEKIYFDHNNRWHWR